MADDTKAPNPNDANDPRAQFLHQMAPEIELRFSHHPPIGNQAERYEIIRTAAKGFARMLVSLCPPCREASLALTKLEECIMWANSSIARRESEAPMVEVAQ